MCQYPNQTTYPSTHVYPTGSAVWLVWSCRSGALTTEITHGRRSDRLFLCCRPRRSLTRPLFNYSYLRFGGTRIVGAGWWCLSIHLRGWSWGCRVSVCRCWRSRIWSCWCFGRWRCRSTCTWLRCFGNWCPKWCFFHILSLLLMLWSWIRRLGLLNCLWVWRKLFQSNWHTFLNLWTEQIVDENHFYHLFN